MEDWQHFSDPRFALRFNYPSRTIDGEPVDRLEMQQTNMIRLHILAPQSRHVYFEVSKYHRLTALDEYKQHKEFLLTLCDPLTISELREARCATLPAHEYTLQWDQGRRAVLLIERADGLYRILYDPGFTVNVRILSTLEWLS
ncbi:MAG TPA: hypothetical protein VK900_15565 [Anaerolineales bacterium]|nr:hypothetical protein [Anaerolineales bacterium]